MLTKYIFKCLQIIIFKGFLNAALVDRHFSLLINTFRGVYNDVS